MSAAGWIRVTAVIALLPVVASAQPRFQPPPPAFQMPSGNVHCLFAQGTLRCDVLEHAGTEAPRPADCAAWGGHLALRAEGQATLPCRAASVRNDDVFVLGYGARWIGAEITCESEEAGLRCRNAAGHGFQVSRTRLDLF